MFEVWDETGETRGNPHFSTNQSAFAKGLVDALRYRYVQQDASFISASLHAMLTHNPLSVL